MNPDHLFAQLKKHIQKISLSPEEDFALREQIFKGIPSPYLAKPHYNTTKTILEEWLRGSTSGHPFRRVMNVGALAFSFLVVVSAGVVVAADNSLPGNLLYPIKTNVNEEVQSFIRSTPEEKLAYEITRTNTRLNEATKLAYNGELTDENSKTIADNIERHTTNAQLEISKIASTNPTAKHQAETKLSSSLKAQSKILKAIGKKSANKQIQKLAILVTDKVNEEESRQKLALLEVKKEDNKQQSMNPLYQSKITDIALSDYAQTSQLINRVLKLSDDKNISPENVTELALISTSTDKLLETNDAPIASKESFTAPRAAALSLNQDQVSLFSMDEDITTSSSNTSSDSSVAPDQKTPVEDEVTSSPLSDLSNKDTITPKETADIKALQVTPPVQKTVTSTEKEPETPTPKTVALPATQEETIQSIVLRFSKISESYIKANPEKALDEISAIKKDLESLVVYETIKNEISTDNDTQEIF